MQEGQLSYEDAIIARQNYVRVNREKVQLMKEEVHSSDYRENSHSPLEYTRIQPCTPNELHSSL